MPGGEVNLPGLHPGAAEAIVEILRPRDPIAIYLFGSRAEGLARPDSDLDIAALLRTNGSSRRLRAKDRLTLIDQLTGAVGCDVDLVFLDEARLPIRFDIIKLGFVLWESSFAERTDAEDLIVRDYLDFRPLLERSFRETLEAVRETSGPYWGQKAHFNQSFVADHIQTAKRSIARLHALRAVGGPCISEVSSDEYAIADHHLRRALEALFDLGRHIAVKLGLGNPTSYREISDLLRQGDVISADLAAGGRALAACRNRLVHDYAAVGGEEMNDMLRTKLGSMEELLERLGDYARAG